MYFLSTLQHSILNPTPTPLHSKSHNKYNVVRIFIRLKVDIQQKKKKTCDFDVVTYTNLLKGQKLSEVPSFKTSFNSICLKDVI